MAISAASVFGGASATVAEAATAAVIGATAGTATAATSTTAAVVSIIFYKSSDLYNFASKFSLSGNNSQC